MGILAEIQTLGANMKTIINSICFFFLGGFNLFGQSSYNSLREKISNADSILVISYKSKGDSIQGLHYLLQEKDFESSLLKGRHRLNKNRRAELKNILTSGDKILGRKTTTRYFKPRNAILIYKNASMSYIDICFLCGRIDTTKDIDFDDFDIKPDKWKRLKQFFKDFKLIDN